MNVNGKVTVPDNVSLAKDIQREREQRGMNRTQLAALIGVSSQSVGRWEKGAEHPSGKHLLALQRVLGISLGESALVTPDVSIRPDAFKARVDDHVQRQVDLLEDLQAAIRALTDKIGAQQSEITAQRAELRAMSERLDAQERLRGSRRPAPSGDEPPGKRAAKGRGKP